MVPMSRSHHVRVPAPAAAQHVVEHTWVMRAPAAPTPWRALLVPNGRPSVVVCLGEPGERIDPIDGDRSPNAGSVAGVRRVPAVLEQQGEAWYVGARLRPYGLALLGLDVRLVDDAAPLEILSDGRSDGETFDVAGLVTRLREAADDDAAGHLLASELAAAVDHDRVPSDRIAMIDRAVAVLGARRGLVTAIDLARSVGTPATILDTAFDEHVGVGLDEFTAVSRFHHFVGGPGGPEQGRAAVRVLHRYRVEGRTPRETLRFTGLPPAQYREVRDAVAALLEPSHV